MDVKLEQYRIFYRVAVNKSFTAGAEELFLTQSAVSQSVKALEEAVGAALFIRGKRGVELTQEGRILFEYVGSALSLIEQGQAELGKVKTLDGGELRIGVGDTVSRYLLLPSLERFSRMHPKVELKIFNRVSRETIELLRHGQIDIAMVNMPIDPTGVHLAGEVPVQDCFVAGVDFARRLEGTRLTYEEIARLPLILLDSRSSSRRFIDARFGERGIVLHPEIELGSHDLLLDGIDIPPVENLVFFTRGTSGEKFFPPSIRGTETPSGCEAPVSASGFSGGVSLSYFVLRSL